VHCPQCKSPQEYDGQRVSFRATCSVCSSDLHVCVNCKYHNPPKPNECDIPNTEPISDREKYNFCEEFSPKSESECSPPSSDSAFRLLGKRPPSSPSFKDLFKDEEN